MIRFANIQFIYALGILPLMVLVFFLVMRWKKRALQRLGDSDIISRLVPDVSLSKQSWKFILFLAAFFFLLVAMIDPQVGSREEEAKQEGIDIMICLDVSNSMMAEDLSPNRLERAKQAIAKLTEKLHGDRIGIVVFAGQAFVQLPITSDYGAAKLFLDNIDCDIVPVQGTAIGTAIDMAAGSFGAENTNSKAIIVITDGENHEDDAVASAKKAAEKGITVHTIGMGSPEGGPIPIYSIVGTSKVKEGFKKDAEGNTVVTKLDQKMLTEISAAGNGVYVRANNTEAGLNTVMAQLEKMQRSQMGSKHYTDYEDRFQVFLLLSIILVVTELLLTERKLKWWVKLDLFGENK